FKVDCHTLNVEDSEVLSRSKLSEAKGFRTDPFTCKETQENAAIKLLTLPGQPPLSSPRDSRTEKQLYGEGDASVGVSSSWVSASKKERGS
ncbi:hypothetical protein D5086_031681, partial [Populus alba]